MLRSRYILETKRKDSNQNQKNKEKSSGNYRNRGNPGVIQPTSTIIKNGKKSPANITQVVNTQQATKKLNIVIPIGQGGIISNEELQRMNNTNVNKLDEIKVPGIIKPKQDEIDYKKSKDPNFTSDNPMQTSKLRRYQQQNPLTDDFLNK